jgi:cytochrome c oxidase subunit 3
MAGKSVLDDIELIIEDVHGGGGGKPPERGGDGDDGGDDGGERERWRKSGDSSQKKRSTAIALAMLSILVLFLTLTAAFVFLRLYSLKSWSSLRLPWILWANTAVLVASSGTLELARRKLRSGRLPGFRWLWALTTILGVVFVGGQVIAWQRLVAQGVFMRSSLASSFFYVFTAVHAIHLLGGIGLMLYVGLRKFDAARISRNSAAELVSYYWHFMDGLWIFLLALMYFGR